MLDKDLRTIKKTYKVPYIAPSTWRQLFLIESNEAYLNEKRVVHDRSSTIPPIFSNVNTRIYTGKRYIICEIDRWLTGFKFGEFTWNRKVALYKAKQLRKKAKKNK
jgi:ribosomal protein S19